MLVGLLARPRRAALSVGLAPVRCMSRVGKVPIKVPASVTIKVDPIPESELPPFRQYSKKRLKYALRNRPARDGFQVFGQPHRVTVEGPLGELSVPVHSFCRVEHHAESQQLHVTPQCGGETKMGKTLWGTTRGYLANAVKGVSQGFRKELELKGVGFKARVEPQATAAVPAGEQRAVTFRLGTEKYAQSPYHKQPSAPTSYDPQRGGVLHAGGGGGFQRFRHPLTPASASTADGDALMLRIGFCHEVRVDFPTHLKVSSPSPTQITIFGIDKQQVRRRDRPRPLVRALAPPPKGNEACRTRPTSPQALAPLRAPFALYWTVHRPLRMSLLVAPQVGLAAQRVRLLRKPDPYKGKGIRYAGEVVKLKVGKRK